MIEANTTTDLLSFTSAKSPEAKGGVAKSRWLAVARLQFTSPFINAPVRTGNTVFSVTNYIPYAIFLHLQLAE